MKCPVCEKEMENGLLQVRGDMAWVRQKHNFSLSPEKGEIFIYKYNTLSSIILNACICKSCEKIVIDYSNSGYQEG